MEEDVHCEMGMVKVTVGHWIRRQAETDFE